MFYQKHKDALFIAEKFSSGMTIRQELRRMSAVNSQTSAKPTRVAHIPEHPKAIAVLLTVTCSSVAS